MNFKKLLAAGTAAAMMVGASFTAFAATPTVSGPSEAKTGDTVTYKVALSGTDKGLSADVSFKGLEFVSVDNANCGAGQAIILTDLGGSTATYTFKVTAAAGEDFSFTLGNLDVSDENGNPATSDATVVSSGKVAAEETPADPEQPGTETPGTETPGTETPGTQTPAPGTTPEADGTTVEKPAKGKAPKTGDFGAVQLIKGLFR